MPTLCQIPTNKVRRPPVEAEPMSAKTEQSLPSDAITTIPDSLSVRRLIGTKYAEILVLKRLLRAAESRSRLFPPDGTPSDKKPGVPGA